ncbi:MAG TPA: presqualene diphosphate synthase HpnD [Candidatus Sulfotelmatobacter sp.]|nr:presqualene diphosphate synthase HpnD [Candidatus Sulfotelmatobacter sp.]
MTDVAARPSVGAETPDLAAAIEARVRAAGTSFYWGMRLLPAPRRAAMYAIYAFCREVDDIADDAPAAEKAPGLAGWRREIAALYAGHPSHPIARALLAPVAAYKLDQRDFLAIIDGMEMDATRDIRAPSLAELDLYCARVAGAVGRLSVRAFGDDTARALDVAEALGRALQLTNILRDLAEDAARGRLYLPRELLDAHGIASSDPHTVLAHPALPKVCAEVARMARARFAEAERAMADCSRRAMRPAALMKAMYRAILDRLERRGWTALDRPVKTPKALKLWLVVRHGLI